MSPRTAYTRGLIDYPSVLIVAGSLAMWLLWPQLPTPAKPHTPPRQATRVRYLDRDVESSMLFMSPTLFARSSRVGFGLPERTEAVPAEPRTGLSPRPRCLAWPDASRLVPEIEPERLELPRRKSELAWVSEPTFTSLPSPKAQVHVEMSGALADAGYAPATLSASNLVATVASGMVVLFVELDARGRAQHVYLERGTKNETADRMALQAVVAGRGTPSDKPAAGRVTLSWGGTP